RHEEGLRSKSGRGDAPVAGLLDPVYPRVGGGEPTFAQSRGAKRGTPPGGKEGGLITGGLGGGRGGGGGSRGGREGWGGGARPRGETALTGGTPVSHCHRPAPSGETTAAGLTRRGRPGVWGKQPSPVRSG